MPVSDVIESGGSGDPEMPGARDRYRFRSGSGNLVTC